MTVLECLKTGRANAVSRGELVRLTGMPDRACRREIERLRREGVPVVSLSDARGYWLAEDAAELGRFLREVDARLRAQSYPALRKLAAKGQGSRAVPVRAHLRRLARPELEGQVSL